MDGFMDTIGGFFRSILYGIPSILYAILLLVIAFAAATIVKALVVKLLKAIKIENLLGKAGVNETATKNASEFLGKLAYFVTFLLFLPAVLDKLGMQSVSSPIIILANSFLAFVPKLIGAGIIVAVGVFIANIIKELLVPILKAVKVDALQEKAGIEASETSSFSYIIANVVYAVILLVVITSALDELGIYAISQPANAVVESIFAAIPNVLCAILIIAIGVFIANLVGKLLEALLAGVGTDKLLEKITGSPSKKIALSKAIAAVVKYVLMVIFLVQGVNVLKLPILTQIGAAIIAYMPAVLSAIIIIAIGMFAANTTEAALNKKFPNAKASALIAKVAIYVLVAFLCLSQLGIATAIVETTFILIIAALCVAFAVAFGVGGRQFAAHRLEELEEKIGENKSNGQ